MSTLDCCQWQNCNLSHCIVYTNDDMFYILRAMPSLDQMNKNKMKCNESQLPVSGYNLIQ